MGHTRIRALSLFCLGFAHGAKRGITPTSRCSAYDTCEIDVSHLGNIDSQEALAIQLTHWAPTHVYTLKNSAVADDFVAAPLSRDAIPHPDWYGEDEQPNTSNATINIVKERKHGVDYVFASVVDEENVFQVSTRYDGVSQVQVVPSIDFPPEGEPMPLPGGLEFDDDRQLQENYKNQDLRLGPEHRGLANDDGSILDLMVVWTKSAECMVGGYDDENCAVWERTKDAMEAKVALAVRETNEAFRISGVDTRLRLVHAYRHPNYKETEDSTFNYALNHITTNGDGYMDDVHDKRAQYGADVVALIIDDRALCGLGWMGPNKDFMFSVSSWRCATGYFSFGHEIAHNLGCQHDTGTTGCKNNNVEDYAYGYRDPEGSFRSIMAYGCKTGQCDDVTKTSPCTRLQYFSNPNSRVSGRRIGYDAADNARRINDVRAIVASYYPVASECRNDNECTSDGSCIVGKCGDEWMGIDVCNYYNVCQGQVPPEGGTASTGSTPNPTPSTPNPTPSTPNPTRRTPSPTRTATPSPTRKKTPSPTVGSTARPTPPPTAQARVCPNGQSVLEVELLTDGNPREIQWRLENECTGQLALESDRYNSANKLYDSFYCVASGMTYTFVIEDSGGNGLCCEHGAGSFKLEYEGAKVMSGAEFKSIKVRTFGSSCPQPTTSPTDSPTTEPTAEPTETPTETPTAEEKLTGRLCADDPEWAFESRGGTLYGCEWVAFQKELYCRKEGIDGMYAMQACRAACGACPQQ